MSAHDWPEFEKRDDIDVFCPANRIVIFDGSHREFALIDKAQYNYAKVRIDGYDALQQRCEELVNNSELVVLKLSETLNLLKALNNEGGLGHNKHRMIQMDIYCIEQTVKRVQP